MKKVYVWRKGAGDTVIPMDFRDLKRGDVVFADGVPIEIAEDAHLCGDASYDGYLCYDTDDNSVFPDSLDGEYS